MAGGDAPRLTEQIKGLRRSIAAEMGFVLPPVRIQDNLELPADTYAIRVKEIEAARGELRPTMLQTMGPSGSLPDLPGERTTEPAFGLPALWINTDQRELALLRNLTVVDPASVLTTHLTEIVRDSMAELLSYAETMKLLDDLPREQQKLVSDLIPSQISAGGVQRVLQILLTERVSLRDLPTILEGIQEACGGGMRAIPAIAGHVRSRLARQISDSHTGPAGYIPLVTLSPEWEAAFSGSLVGPVEDRQLAIAPTHLGEFMQRFRAAFEVLPHFACCLPLVPGWRIGETVDSRPWRSPSCPLPCCPRCPVRLNSSPFCRPLTMLPLKPGCLGVRWTVQLVAYPHGGFTVATRVCFVICPGKDARRRSGLQRGGSGVSIPHVAARPSPSVLVRSRRCRRDGRPGSGTFNATSHSPSAVKPRRG